MHYGEVFETDGTCKNCPEGSYAINLNNNSQTPCSSCDDQKAYCFGGELVAPKSGYWRKNETANLVISCPNPAVCLGNNDTNEAYNPSGECLSGYHGNLCNACPEGYASDNNICVECYNNSWYYIRFV